ncbi:Class III cytochrome C family protein [Desulfonatronum zhilinae]|nr:Class III cytochrome C family protein [Desulfonatronum zhilinae]
MKKSPSAILASVAFALLFMWSSTSAARTELIAKPEGIETRQKSVVFSHGKHETMECIACHHTSGGTEVDQGCKDTGCHDMFVVETPEQRRDVRYFQKAYHDLCIGCHADFKKREQPGGPVDCKGCHTQE